MMRGGPRLMCSPYLTGSLGIMLCVVTFNYWSVATQNSDLSHKIEELQQQLKMGSSHIQSLEEETRDIRSQLKTYKDRVLEERELKKEVESKFKSISKDKDSIKQKLEQLTDENSEKEETEKRLSEKAEEQAKTIDSLRDELEELNNTVKGIKDELSSCQSDLSSERADKLLKPSNNAMPPRHLPNSNNLGPGQLPNVNPASVSVIKKETQGSGLQIVDGNEMKNVSVNNTIVHNLSSTHKPRSDNGNQNHGVVPAPKIIVNEAGVMPIPNSLKNLENLDNAEDDSQIAQHENGPEGKKEILDDDQNPDGQIDETVDLDKQHYLVDKAQEESVDNEKILPEKSKDLENSLENGGEDNLDNLKESLNKVEE